MFKLGDVWIGECKGWIQVREVDGSVYTLPPEVVDALREFFKQEGK